MPITGSEERGPLWTLKQLAEHFNISEKTAKRLPIAFTKIGRQRRYHPTLIKRYEVLNASRPLDWKEVA